MVGMVMVVGMKAVLQISGSFLAEGEGWDL